MIRKLIVRIRDWFGTDNLKGKCLRGGTALISGNLVNQGAALVRMMILTRLLLKEEFGLMGLVVSTVQAFESFSQVGIRTSVIQNKKGDQPEYLNVAWWFASLRGLALFLCACAIAPLVSDFYDSPRLLPLLRVSFLMLLFRGLISPRAHVLEKKFHFSRWVVLMQLPVLTGIGVSIGLAFYFRNVWALVIGFASEGLVRTVLSFILCPFKPRFHIDRACLKEVMSFARGMFGMPILVFLFRHADLFIIGKIVTKDQLGMYFLARNLAIKPVMLANMALHPLILPLFSAVQDDLSKVRRGITRISSMGVMVAGPMAAAMIIFSGQILSVVYGPSYRPARHVFSAFAVYMVLQVLVIVASQVYMAMGRPELQRRFVIIRAVLFAALIFPLLIWLGLVGAAIGVVVATAVAFWTQINRLSQVVGLKWKGYTAGLLPGVVTTALVAVLGVTTTLLWTGRNVSVELTEVGFWAWLTSGDVMISCMAGVWCAVGWGAGLLWLLFERRRRNGNGVQLDGADSEPGDASTQTVETGSSS